MVVCEFGRFFGPTARKVWSSYVTNYFRIVYVYAKSFRLISNDTAMKAGVAKFPYFKPLLCPWRSSLVFHSLRGRRRVL